MILYLDIDGCLNPYPRMGKTSDFDDFDNHKIVVNDTIRGKSFAQEYTLRLSPKMGKELLNLGIEIVWTTTWCDHPQQLSQIAKIVGLDHCRQLHFNELGLHDSYSSWEHYRQQKLYGVINDALKHQMPFIWCDDEAIGYVAQGKLKRMEDELPPYQLIFPKSIMGITSSEIDMMRRFIRSQA